MSMRIERGFPGGVREVTGLTGEASCAGVGTGALKAAKEK